MHCINLGCPCIKFSTIDEMFNHIKKCDWELVSCELCAQVMQRRQLKQHLRNDCLKGCTNTITHHFEKPMKVYNAPSVNIASTVIQANNDKFSSSPSTMYCHYVGCNFRCVQEQDLTNHCENSINEHVKLMNEEIVKCGIRFFNFCKKMTGELSKIK